MLRRFSVCLLLLSLLSHVPATPAQEAAAKKPDAEGAKRFEPWDVEGDHGPSQVVEFDTDEGTWMSCDVSPDGRQIVFDLLGDIYSMPLEGGAARLVAGGAS